MPDSVLRMRSTPASCGVALHAVLVLPLLAWWLARSDRTETRRRELVAIGTGGYVLASAIALIVCLARA